MAGADEEIGRVRREDRGREIRRCIGSCTPLDVNTGWRWTIMACWEDSV